MAITYPIYQLCYDYIHLTEGLPYDEIRQLPFNEIANKSRPYFFNFNYEIFNEDYRQHLEEAFIMHFFLYEIGFDTPTSFLQQLMADWIIKIPTYNKFYETVDMISEPLNSVDVVTTQNSEASTQSNNTSHGETENTSTSNATGTYSDYPQTILGDLDYGTSGTKDGSTSTAQSSQDSTGEATGTSTTDTTNTTKGYNGIPQSTLLMQYRNTLLNIDLLFFNDLQMLFLGVY